MASNDVSDYLFESDLILLTNYRCGTVLEFHQTSVIPKVKLLTLLLYAVPSVCATVFDTRYMFFLGDFIMLMLE